MGIRHIITTEIDCVNNNFQDFQDLTPISDMATATKALYPANKQVITKCMSVVFMRKRILDGAGGKLPGGQDHEKKVKLVGIIIEKQNTRETDPMCSFTTSQMGRG